MADAWNNGSTVFTAIKMNVTDTTSAAGSMLMDLQLNGSSIFKVYKTALVDLATNGQLRSNTITIYSGGAFNFNASDANAARLYGEASGTIAQRAGANPQAYRLYNTFTDNVNWERGVLGWASNTLEIGTEAAGTGTNRGVRLKSASALTLNAANGDRWQITSAGGHFLALVDNTYDIGSAGASRPRSIYAATGMTATYMATGTAIVDATTWLNIGASQAGRSHLRLTPGAAKTTSPVDGDMWFTGTAVQICVGGVIKTFTLT